MSSADNESNGVFCKSLIDASASFSNEVAARNESVYRIFHHCLANLMSVDACYISFLNASSGTLKFAYNFDGFRIDDPIELTADETRPSGWVVKNARSLLYPDADPQGIHHNGVSFGDPNKLSASAIHTPIWATSPENVRHIIGVCSVQSYTPSVYSRDDVAVVEWFASQIGVLHEREKAAEVFSLLQTTLQSEQGQERLKQLAMRKNFEAILESIRKAGEQAFLALPQENPDLVPLVEAMYHLRRTFYESQIELRQMFDAPSEIRDLRIEADAKADVLLTDREKEILRLFPSNMTYGQIGQTLKISVHTVHSHRRKIFTKLRVTTRPEAVSYIETHGMSR